MTSRWIYKIKHATDGSVEKYIDYDETFAPVSRYTTIRTIISLAAVFGWKLHRMDVNTAFLNGKIEEEFYIEQPEGFVTHGKKTHVCKLKKALYGLKQAPRVWYARMDGFLHSLGFSKSTVDSNLYFKVVHNHVLILVLYVDDLILTGDE